jgi:hypothetical protein
LDAVQSTLGVGGRGREIFASATCSLQFAKASAATLSQQEKRNLADAQRRRADISGFICTVASSSSRRRTFEEFLSLAAALQYFLVSSSCFLQKFGTDQGEGCTTTAHQIAQISF